MLNTYLNFNCPTYSCTSFIHFYLPDGLISETGCNYKTKKYCDIILFNFELKHLLLFLSKHD